ncbi:Sigma-70 domain containing protein [Halorhabdus tiamatea SARL4B]|uniref:Sigma-70 domain containing protein n=1 Tax=Halorhabdus tiamatea SARL4B TaxID=1033806 RepID=F7PI28_9EURY|nr:sigma-70 region 4 domain-containing protein [Halorhabdus tiamatea]ERJ06622.1 Sigma-70 domain containing protein [Halorhabdus tiamatea SARL4B]CCQ32223.1 hypothetical protein HTIA_0072 [Halorhabdus tiamatea SARL4B]
MPDTDTSDKDTITEQDLAVLLRDGHNGLDANMSRMALERVVEDWENHAEKDEKLEFLRDSPMDIDFVIPDVRWDADKEEFYVGTNRGPGTLGELTVGGGFHVAGEFSRDYVEAYRQQYQDLLDESMLSKKQFMAYVMREANKNEHVIADALGVKTGTVRSHAGRAREKVEKAEATARIPELFTFEGYDELQENMAELLEPQPQTG